MFVHLCSRLNVLVFLGALAMDPNESLAMFLRW